MIAIENLVKRHGAREVLHGVSLEARPGRVTGFVGPNGAGKSSTLRCLLGLDRADSGRALIGGRPYRELREPLRTVGAVLDGSGAHPSRTARGHLGWVASGAGISRRRVAEVLDVVGLSEAAGRRVRTFSLGMGQRLGLATALLGDPEVLVLDEPVNGLDPEGIRWIRRLLRQRADAGARSCCPVMFWPSWLRWPTTLSSSPVGGCGRPGRWRRSQRATRTWRRRSSH